MRTLPLVLGAWVLLAGDPGSAEPSPGRGLTWGVSAHDPSLNLDLVGCYGLPRTEGTQGGACDPRAGDTSCLEARPVLCIKPGNLPRPPYAMTGEPHAMPREYYRGWSGGHVGLTRPVPGTALTSLERANELCAKALGPGFRMAEHHDGRWVPGMDGSHLAGKTWPSQGQLREGGWHWYAFGNVSNASRFWVHINDQRGNCWNGAAPVEPHPGSRAKPGKSK